MKKGKGMKRFLCIAFICVLSIMLTGCAGQEQPKDSQWEISVPCVEDPEPGAYVISYGGVTVSSETGMLTLQNRNDFEITVHLSCNGQEEQVFNIQPGGVTVFHQAVKQEPYTVGIHAEVKDGTEMKLAVYDGERAEVY